MQIFFRSYLFYAKKTWLHPFFWMFFIAPFIFGSGFSLPVGVLFGIVLFLTAPIMVRAKVYYKNT